MQKWTEPELLLFSVKTDENIAVSGRPVDEGEKMIGEFWYTGQGYGNKISGNFYYSIIGNKKLVQDTYKVGGDNNIPNSLLDGAIASCQAW